MSEAPGKEGGTEVKDEPITADQNMSDVSKALKIYFIIQYLTTSNAILQQQQHFCPS